MGFPNARDIAPQSPQQFEPQRSFEFEVEIQFQQELIRLATESVPLPTHSNSILEVHHGNEVSKVAGKATFEDLSLTLVDYVDKDTALAMSEWRRLVYNPETGVIGLASDYKKMGHIVLYGPGGDGRSFFRAWRIEGVWPSELNPGEFDYSNDDFNRIEVTLAIDHGYRLQG